MPLQKNTNHHKIFRYTGITILLVGVGTLVGQFFRLAGFPETNVVVVYILCVLLTARFTKGYAYGIIASILATVAFNFFYTAPYFSLSVYDLSYLVTFAIMTMTAIITSALTSKARQNAIESREKELEASALYRLTSGLTEANDLGDISSIAASAVSNALNCHAAFLCFDELGRPERSFIQQREDGRQIQRETGDPERLRQGFDRMTEPYLVGEAFYDWPIHGKEMILGVIRIPKEEGAAVSGPHLRLLQTMAENIALAMDRFRSAQGRIRMRDEAMRERYHSNLLRAISHDLRTPLAGIMGTAEVLMDMTGKGDERHALAEGIYKDADWLHALVENILSLTRLQAGDHLLNKQMEAVEEIIGGAVAVLAKRAPEHEITVQMPHDLLLVPMDARLIELTLINLLDNAAKATPPGKEISISAACDRENALAIFTVADRGAGLAEADMPNLFKMFYTTSGNAPDAARGIGLGLSICESIINAHGGTIAAHGREDGPGAVFTFTLPLEDRDSGEQA